jgi:hypothetical protein
MASLPYGVEPLLAVISDIYTTNPVLEACRFAALWAARHGVAGPARRCPADEPGPFRRHPAAARWLHELRWHMTDEPARNTLAQDEIPRSCVCLRDTPASSNWARGFNTDRSNIRCPRIGLRPGMRATRSCEIRDRATIRESEVKFA